MKQKIETTEDLADLLDQIEDLKTKMPINEDDLVTECVRQPVLHQDVGDMSADVKDFVDRLEIRFQNTQEDLRKLIRNDPTKYLGAATKVTEGAIGDAIANDKAVRDLQQDLLDAKSVQNKVKVLVERIQSRKSMIGHLVDMRVSSFYTSGDMSRPRRALLESKGERLGERRLRERSEDDGQSGSG